MRAPPPPLPRIRTPRLILRLAEIEDVPEIVRYIRENREFLQPWEPRRTEAYYSEDYWKRQVAQNIEDFHSDRSLRLFLFFAEGDRQVIGNLSFNNFVRGAAQFCHCGYALAEVEQGKGLMYEGLKAALSYVFNDVGMHRVMANYMPRNQRSGALLQRLGFVIEGTAKDYLLINGRWEDHVLTSLLNKDWRTV